MRADEPADAPPTAPPTAPQNVSFADVLAEPAAAPDAVTRYGPAPEQRIEAWYPDGPGPDPVVVLLHGGCWLNAYGVDHARAMATALRAAGFAVLAPEYRRVGDAGGGWPGTFEDVAAALDGLARAPDPRLDLDRLALVGHSAGGHLALWLAARSGMPADATLPRTAAVTPALVVALAGIPDLARYAQGDSSCQVVTPRLMGGMPDAVADRYAQASPQRLPAPSSPVVLIQGTEDRIVPLEQTRAYAAHVETGGGDVRIEWVQGAGHFDLIHPRTAAFARLQAVLAPLLAAP